MTNEMEAAKPHKQTKHTPMTHYIDGFVIPLPKNKIDDYRRIAQKAGEVWRDHGALEYRECVGEDLDVEAQVPFPHLMDASAMPFDCKRMAYRGFQVVVEDFPPRAGQSYAISTGTCLTLATCSPGLIGMNLGVRLASAICQR